jgi:acyl-CoA hydrolase
LQAFEFVPALTVSIKLQTAGMYMNGKTGVVTDDVAYCVDEVIKYLGNDIKASMPLGLGKPMLFINELYRRAKENPEIKLVIMTALTLEVPKGKTDLEKRILKPIVSRIFEGVRDFDFLLDYKNGRLPENVTFSEMYSKAGSILHEPESQMNHVASNYSHAVRDGVDNGANIFGQLLSVYGDQYSMGCNTDLGLEAIPVYHQRRKNGEKCVLIGEVNSNLPFMYGDAVVDKSEYDFILQGEQYNLPLFGAPKDSISLSDHMIGLNVSTLIKDGGTIQVGIGALGDAIVSGLIMRNDHNEVYRDVIEKAEILPRYDALISKWGDTGVFKQGLYGSSEMFVDAFIQMYKSQILKRKVFNSIPLMKLINSGELSADKIPENIIDKLIEMKAINPQINEDDFNFMTKSGILKDGVKYSKSAIKDGSESYSTDMSESVNLLKIRKILGEELKGGEIICGAFYFGPRSFYKALNDMPEEERMQFGMSGVNKVNQLYGDEELRRLQRKDGRFINTGMTASIFGSIASDQLPDGRVVSGIGGQYDFAAMAHALEDGRLIMMIKSVKGSGKSLKSNIVFNYPQCSVPRHLRDIIVTEYGIADIRGKSDRDIIAAMINIADSRFQKELLHQAKKAKKIPADYEIPEEYRYNTPEKIAKLLKPYQENGYFRIFPFGTDFKTEEVMLASSMKNLKGLATAYPLKLLKGLLKETFRPVPESAGVFLEHMELKNPTSLKERIMRNMVVFALRNNKMIK